MVDGLQAVCTILQTSSSAGLKMPEALQAAAEAASRAADATAEMVPRIGRASWVPDRARGHPDAGCAVLAIALQAVAETAGS
jgi:dihydroxyacetone kinase